MARERTQIPEIPGNAPDAKQFRKDATAPLLKLNEKGEVTDEQLIDANVQKGRFQHTKHDIVVELR